MGRGLTQSVLVLAEFMRRRCNQSLSLRARRRLARWIDDWQRPDPENRELQIVPLEPRLVLNATAEFNPLGQLLIGGTNDAEIVRLEIESNGDLSLRDGSGAAIPIENHPDGPGNETNPIDRASVNEVQFDMLDGDDRLELQIPRGIDISVLPGDGSDETSLGFAEFDSTTVASNSSISIDSDSIQILPSMGFVSLADATVQLNGRVDFGAAGFQSVIDVTRASLQVDGSFVLEGAVTFFGPGVVDLSDAIVTTTSPDTDLRVDLGTNNQSSFVFGGADDSAGEKIRSLSVNSASAVTFGPMQVVMLDDLTIQQVSGPTLFASTVEAGSVTVSTIGDIEVSGEIATAEGGIGLATTSSIQVSGELDSTAALSLGRINLRADSVAFSDANIVTAGGLVNVSGPVTIDGDVQIDSGDGQLAPTAGRVQIVDAVTAADGIGDTLQIDARASGLDGTVRLQGPIDLNGLDVDADRIEVDTVAVRSGNIRLRANVIRMLADDIRTTDSGAILFDGTVLLPVGDTFIAAADQVQFTSTIRGQSGTRDLRVDAGTDALFDGEIEMVNNLAVTSIDQSRFSGDVTLDANFDVDADRIRIEADVDTTAGSADGSIQLQARTEISIGGNADVQVGQNVILMDADGGRIDTAESTLRSSAMATAITARDTSRLILGNVVVPVGQVVLGIDRDLVGPTNQAAGTTVVIDRLFVSSSSSIDLSNAGNEIATIEQIHSAGEVTIRDDTNDLAIVEIDSSGSNVDITAAGTIGLAPSAITAIGAATRMTAGDAIIDSGSNETANVETSIADLVASRIGSIENPVDVVASTELNASTSNVNGDISIANQSGDIPVGRIDAGAGDITLTAITINDASDDAQVDLIGDRMNLSSVNGIGNADTLETSVRRLRGEVSAAGPINLVEQDAIEIESLVTSDGPISLTSGAANQSIDGNVNGSIVAMDVRSLGETDEDIEFVALGVPSDIVIAHMTASGESDIAVTAGDDVRSLNTTSLVRADDLSIVAHNQTGDQPLAIDLQTNIADFEASVLGTERGDLRIIEQDRIRLASSDAAVDEIVETFNGQIEVRAGERIEVVDHSVGDDGDDRKGDPEIIARDLDGSVGRVDLEVPGRVGEIELDQTVQIVAEKKTPDAQFPDPTSRTTPPELGLNREDRAVFIKADSIVLGTQIEIFTGEDQGTARVFSPRPLDLEPPSEDEPFPDPATSGDGDSAFFIPSTVRTNTLEQAVVNDATGILTVNIGQSGEHGLSVDVDWGAPTEPGTPGQPERFQRIDGLSADAATFVDQNGGIVEGNSSPDSVLSIEHFYTEANVLESRANDRTAATEPFDVRFSVRHHASIQVLGSVVQQSRDAEVVAGGVALDNLPGELIGVVSSTDDPSTDKESPPGLENGRATFIIPSLSIPVAFFPVREVIPEIETTEFVVRAETSVAFTPTTFETAETAVVPTVTRDEFFQIRVLSADPDGEDVAVARLPDDILDGDKIKNLLGQLPDGSYEIEYVLGDSTRRLVLRVDVRGGEATIPGESFDEGILRLREIADRAPRDGETGEPDAADNRDDEEEDVEPVPRSILEEDEQPGPEDQSSREMLPTWTPLVGGLTLTTALSRRNRRSRFSVAAASARRRNRMTNESVS